MLNWLRSLLLSGSENRLRADPGAGTYSDLSGRVIYNMLDPTMKQFMGRSIGAIKRERIKAKGTGAFSVLLGDQGSKELLLDSFWSEYLEAQDEAVFERIAVEAKRLTNA